MRHMGWLSVLLAVAVALVLGAGTAGAQDDDDDDNEVEKPFEEAHIFFELNNTDGDLGIHALIDGEAWKRLEIEDPSENKLLNIFVRGSLRRQGLTEIFFESAEPPFDELSPEKFFRRFPEGTYEIEGKTLDGKELESEVELTHVLPAPVDRISLSGKRVDLEDVNCDDGDTIPVVDGSAPVVIRWAAVTTSHPEIGTPDVPVTIHNYEVVVEVEVDVNGEEFTSVFSVVLPPDKTSIRIPKDFIALGDEFKYEILAREESFNQTAVESCFKIDDDNNE